MQTHKRWFGMVLFGFFCTFFCTKVWSADVLLPNQLAIPDHFPLYLWPAVLELASEQHKEYQFQRVRPGQFCAKTSLKANKVCVTRQGLSYSQGSKKLLSIHLKKALVDDRAINLSQVRVLSENNKIKLKYTQELEEWYVNTPQGIEQAYTFSQGGNTKKVARINLLWEIDQASHVPMPIKTSLASLGTGPLIDELYLDQLLAFDAKGKILPLKATIKDNLLQVSVNVEHAQYPVTVDPFYSYSTIHQVSGTKFSDWFGYHVALSGNTAVIGAYRQDVKTVTNAGSAYVFERTPQGVWVQKATLIASDAGANDYFGVSVAVHESLTTGTIVVVGAYHADVGPASALLDNAGAAYVYVKPKEGWPLTTTQTAKLIAADDPLASDLFGRSVAVYQDTVAIGAYGYGVKVITSTTPIPITTHTAEGAIFVFTKPATGWQNTISSNIRLTVGTALAADSLGVSVVMDGNRIAAGAHLADSATTVNTGAVYVFEKPSQGWVSSSIPQFRLVPKNAAAEEQSGISVAMDNAYVLAGASGASMNSLTNSGAGYLYHLPPVGTQVTQLLNESVKLVAKNPELKAALGRSVALDGNRVVLGARHQDVEVMTTKSVVNFTDAGAAFIFHIPAPNLFPLELNESTIITANDSQHYRYFAGGGVAISPHTLLVGAFNDGTTPSDGTTPAILIPVYSGSAYFYETEVDLQVLFSATNTYLSRPEEPFQYSLNVTNKDPDIAVTGITLINEIPSSLSITALPTNCTSKNVNSILEVGCLIDQLAPLESKQLSFTVTATRGLTTAIHARVFSSYKDSDSLNSQASLTLVVNHPPSKPQLISPAHQAKEVGVPAILKWYKVNDEDNDFIRYRVHICATSDFSGCPESFMAALLPFTPFDPRNSLFLLAGAILIFFKKSSLHRFNSILLVMFLLAATACNSAVNELRNQKKGPIDDTVSLTVNALKSNTTYYWKVVAEDGKTTTESDVLNFTTQ